MRVTAEPSFFTLIPCWLMSSPDRSDKVIKSGSKNGMHRRFFFICHRVRPLIKVHLFPSPLHLFPPSFTQSVYMYIRLSC